MGFTHDQSDENVPYAEFRFVFTEPDNEGIPVMGSIESHIHNAPPKVLVEALLHAAKFVIVESLKADTFGDSVPEEAKMEMAQAIAHQHLTHMLSHMAGMPAAVYHIPDDASELFNE